jgi:hypothetical protein
MKLWVDPLSMRATSEAPPKATMTCSVPPLGTPTTACREKTGDSAAGSLAAVLSLSSSSTPAIWKMRRQTRLWPLL